jgi:hypothetical protein
MEKGGRQRWRKEKQAGGSVGKCKQEKIGITILK